MKTYILQNLITGEVLGKVSCHTSEAAREYFNIMFPYTTVNVMMFEIK